VTAVIALFDMDGTLLPWDSQKFFCRHVLRRYPIRRAFLLAYVPLLPFAGILGSEGLKRAFLSFLCGLTEAEVNELAVEFANEWLCKQIWPEMRQIVEMHQQRGDTTVLISASPEPYVSALGRALGFTHVLGTDLESPNGKTYPVFPRLINNKGANKVTRLRELFGAECFLTNGSLRDAHGYTDSCADLPMLALCATNTCINPSKRLTQLAEEKGWEMIRLPRPWKSKLHRLWIRIKCVTGL
jgi:HAD superfamily hydrolase (TIGR01490 family)